jgi:hypothetical protein
LPIFRHQLHLKGSDWVKISQLVGGRNHRFLDSVDFFSAFSSIPSLDPLKSLNVIWSKTNLNVRFLNKILILKKNLENLCFHAFPCFSFCKKYESLHAIGTTKAWNFCRVLSGNFTQPSFMLFPCFSLCKNMKLYTQKEQQKHETFVVSGM